MAGYSQIGPSLTGKTFQPTITGATNTANAPNPALNNEYALMRQYYAAMAETQRRAAEDRAAAIRAVQEAGTAATEGPAYGQWASLVNAIAESPEAINPEVAGQMYEEARLPIEAQTQNNLRDIQRSYYARGVPGGAMLGAVQQQLIGKTGDLASAKRNIAITRALRKREDMTNAANSAGTLAQYYGGVKTQGASTLADILGNTVAAVPGQV